MNKILYYMAMKLSVPFIPDKAYIGFLNQSVHSIESIYFPLYSGPVLDARRRFSKADFKTLLQDINQVEPVKTYCLLNARFISPKLYHDHDFLDRLLDRLNILSLETQLTGIVFSDAYLLTALARREHPVTGKLEAIPGINCMLDSIEKAGSFFDIIEENGFKPPGKIILDRSINRDMPLLEKVCSGLKQATPDLKIELLANEGCIHHCPYKLTHDSQISFSNTGIHPDMNYITNRDIGCHAYFARHPERFFKSPFIRPEDLHFYSSHVDTVKLCGRTLGRKFLIRCIKAYTAQSHTGNLLALMDAAHWLSEQYHIDNKRLDPGFLNMVTQCKKRCRPCNLCCELWLSSARKKSWDLKQYKDYQ